MIEKAYLVDKDQTLSMGEKQAQTNAAGLHGFFQPFHGHHIPPGDTQEKFSFRQSVPFSVLD
jgi:hypothetical protein